MDGKTFWLTAALGGATVKTLVMSDKVDALVSGWEQAIKKIDPEADVREISREAVVTPLLTNEHHGDERACAIISQALLWLLATGELGEATLPFLRRGGVTVHCEITRADEGPHARYRLRMTADAVTTAQMML